MITEKRIPFHVDNLYLRKQLNDEYQEVFDRLYDYLEKDTKKSLFDKNVILNIALQQCLEGIREKKKANLVIPKDLKNYVMKYGRGPVFKEMKKKLRDQDYEKLIISFKCKAKEKLNSLKIYQSKLKKAFLIKSLFQITLTVIGAGLIFWGVKSFLQNMQDVNTFALYTISGIGIWMINITPGIIYNNYCDEHKNQVQELQEFMDLYNNSPLKSKSSLRLLKPY